MLFILRGVAGSGKTWLRNKFFRPDHVLSSDDMRMEMYGTMQEINTPHIWGELHRRLDMRMERKMLTVYDATNLTMKSLKKVVTIANRHGCPFFIVSIDPDLENSLHVMNLRQSGIWDGAIVPREHVEGMIERYHAHNDAVENTYRDRLFRGGLMACEQFIGTALDNLYHHLCYGEETFIIGDIHGNLEILNRLLDKIPPQAKIYSVGDIIDRGENSMGTIFRLLHDQRFMGFTMGNHELAFLQERSGKPCNSKARQRTHEEFDSLDGDSQEVILEFIKGGYPYLILDNVDMRKKVFLSHAGVGTFDRNMVSLRHTIGSQMNPVDNFTGSEHFEEQVHGHFAWQYDGDFSGPVVNIDSGAYDTGVLTAFNPFTREVIQTNA